MAYSIEFFNAAVRAEIIGWPAGINARSRYSMTKKTQSKDRYQPVAFNPKAHAAKKRRADAAFLVAYDALEDEFAALAALLQARKEAGLTQEDVAARMGVSQPVLARIESSLGSRKHSPSLATLRRYADACGKKLVIQMI